MALDPVALGLAKAAARKLSQAARLRALAQIAPRTASDPAVMASPPTFALSGPGGASPITNAVRYPHTTDRVTVTGGQLNTDYNPNGTPARLSKIISAAYASAPFWTEFVHTGTDLCARFINNVAGQSKLWVWVDGQPATAAPVTTAANSSGDLFRQRITFGSAARRIIRIYWDTAAFAGIETGPTDSLSPVPRVQPRCYWLGDSYVEGAAGIAAKDGFGAIACRFLGWEFLGGGQGGTGYVNNGGTGGKAPFGDPARIAALAATQPDFVVVEGSLNDDATSGLQAAVTATLAAIAAAVPSAFIFVIGPQVTTTNVSAARLANRDAVKAAAVGAKNVLAFIDPLDPTGQYATAPAWTTGTAYTVGQVVKSSGVVWVCAIAHTSAGSIDTANFTPLSWVTGTGRVGATTGRGNADILIASDATHLTQDGHNAFGPRAAEGILAAMVAAS